MICRGLVVPVVVFLVGTPWCVRAQCPNAKETLDRVACLERDIVTEKSLAEKKYLTDAAAKKSYVSTDGLNTTLDQKRYVTSEGLRTTLDQKKYVTEGALNEKGFITGGALTRLLAPYAKETTGNYFWIFLAAFLVLLMQAGFLLLEVGGIRVWFDNLQSAYKLSALVSTYIGYTPAGFGLMFGTSFLGVYCGGLGLPGWILDAANQVMRPLEQGLDVRSIGFFLFQAAFAATAVTIPTGSIAERMSLKGFTFVALCTAAVIYPVFGHWAWGGSIYASDVLSTLVRSSDGSFPLGSLKGVTSVGWLQRNGFHDFAGSTVVHSVGGWIALVGALVLGARPGRFGRNARTFKSRSLGLATAGALFLFFGWFGFNGGSALAYSTSVDQIVYATVIAAMAALTTASVYAWIEERLDLKRKGYPMQKAIGGFLGGLVAITASCDLAKFFWEAAVIGATAGIVHNLAFNLLLKLEIDDPVGAIPVHLGCGIWGTACVAILTDNFWRQLFVQATGIIAAFAWTVGTASIIFGILLWATQILKSDWLHPSEREKRLLVV